MRKLLLLLSLAVFIALTAALSYACPASPDSFEVEQNGAVVELGIFGDEFFSWNETSEGLLCAQNSDGQWMYALYDGIELSPTEIPVQLPPPSYAQSGDALTELLDGLELSFPDDADNSSSDDAAVTEQSESGGSVKRWQQNMLVILIEYTDVKLRYDDTYWYNRFFSNDINSVNKYYNEISGGRFSFSAVGGKVWRVTFTDRAHPTPNYSSNNYTRIRGDISDALKALDAQVNYSDYDYNSDGKIAADELHICAVFAGYEAAGGMTTNAIWAHAWQLASMPRLDGVYVGYKYVAQGELYNTAGNPLGIGVACHELGHSLGLPDLYDYGTTGDNYKSRGLGGFSLMSNGNWGAKQGEISATTPVYPDAYCMAYLGFAEVETVTADKYAQYELSCELGKQNLLKIVSDIDSDQYFLVSNRAIRGYDEGLYRYGVKIGGILIYHVDESVIRAGGRINDNHLHKAVDIEEADGSCALDGSSGALGSESYFYKTGGSVLFGKDSSPSSAFHTVTAYHSSDGNCGSSHPQTVETGINIEISGLPADIMTVAVYSDYQGADSSLMSFIDGVAKWAAVTGASHYVLHLYYDYVDATSLPATDDLLGGLVISEEERAEGCKLINSFDGAGSYYFTVAVVYGENESKPVSSEPIALSEYAFTLGGDCSITMLGFKQDGALKAVLDGITIESADVSGGTIGELSDGVKTLNLLGVNSLCDPESGLPVRLLSLGKSLASSLAGMGDSLSLILPDTVTNIAQNLISEAVSAFISSDDGMNILNALKSRLLGLPDDIFTYYGLILG